MWGLNWRAARNTEAAEQDRQQDEGESRRRDKAADDDNGERFLNLRAGSGGEQQRHKTKCSDTGGHHDRPQPANSAFKHNVWK